MNYIIMLCFFLQALLYKMINAAGITYISIGHRSSLSKFHKKALRISPIDMGSEQPNWSIEPLYEG